MDNTINQQTIDTKHSRLMAIYKSLVDARYLIERQWIVNYLTIFTKDKYVLKLDGSIARLQTIHGEKEKLYTRINKLLPIYRAMFSKIYKANPLFRVEPDSLDAEDERGTDLAEALIKQDYQKWKRCGVLSKLAMWFIVTGNSFCKVQYDDDVGDIIGFDKTGEAVKSGEIKLLPIPSFNVYFPIGNEINTINDSRYVFEVILMDRKYAEKVYGIEPNEGRISDSLRYKILLSGDYMDIETNIRAEDYAEFIVYTEKKSKINKNGEFILMTEKRIIKDNKKNPFPDKIGHPYAQAKMIENGTGLGATSIDYSTQTDKEINMSRGQLNEHSEKLASPIIALPMRSQLKSELIGNRRVKVIYYDERYGTPKFLQPSEFSQYFHLNEQKFEEDLNDINAIHDPTQAKKPSGVRSALMLAYLGEQDDLQHAPMVDNFFSMLEVAGTKYLEMKKEFFGDDELDIKIYGNDNITYAKFKGSELKGNTNVKIIVSTGLPMNRIARQQMLMELGASGIIPPSLIRELLEFGELDAVFKQDMKDKTRQEIENEVLMKGEKVDVRIEENHISHLKVIVSFAKTSKFHELPQDKQNNFWRHAQAHIEQMVSTFDDSPLMAGLVLRSETLDPEIKDLIIAEIKKSAQKRIEENTPPPGPEGQGAPLPAPGPGGPVPGPAGPSPEDLMRAQGGMPPNMARLQAMAQGRGQ